MKKTFFDPPRALPLYLAQLFCLSFGLLLPLIPALGLPLALQDAALAMLLGTLLYGALCLFPRLQAAAYPLLFAALCLALRPCLTDPEALRAALLAIPSEGLAVLAPWGEGLTRAFLAFLFACALSGVQASRPFVPAFMLALADAGLLAFLGAAPSLRSLLPLMASVALCACPREGRWPRALLPAAAALLLTLPFLSFAGTELTGLRETAQRLGEKAQDYLFYTDARLPYSLTSAGWQPLGPSQLGGTASPGDAPVLQARLSGAALLRGAVHSVYTGHAFEDPKPGTRYLFADPRYASLRRLLFDQGTPEERLAAFLPAEEEIAVSLEADAANTLFLTQRFSSLRTGDLIPYHSDTGEIFATRSLAEGDAYAFRGRRMTGDTPGIGRIVEAASGGSSGDLSAFLSLPGGVEEEVSRLARKAADGAGSDFERAWRLCSWLRETYPYSLRQNTPPDDRDFVSWFLLTEQRGYCTSFAAAMVVMARTLGLPSRYIEGFSAVPDETGTAKVTQRSAHAWAEIWFPGFGWLPFDPTPADRQGTSSDSSVTPALSLPQPSVTPGPDASAEPPAGPQPQVTPSAGAAETPPPRAQAPSGNGLAGGAVRILPAVVLALLAILALTVIRIVFTAPERGAARLSPSSAVLLWYRSCLQLLECLEFPQQAGEAPSAFLQRAEAGLGGMPKLSRLGELVSRTRYGNVRLTAADAAEAARIHRELCSRLTIRQRLRWIRIRLVRGPIPLAD